MSEPVTPNPHTADWLTPGRFAALLALLLFAAYPQVFLGLQTFVYRDFGYFSYPIAYHLRESFWRGEIPLWNPLSNCGVPFLAQWNTQVLYPPALFYVLFPLSWSLGVFCLLHLYLGGLGMFFLARHWTGNTLASAFAGIAFAFNGVMLNSLMWPATVSALGWMPWVLWLVERAWREGGRMTVVAALVGALQMLSGGVEMVLLTWAWLGALGLMEFVCDQPVRWKILLRSVAAVLLIIGLSAAQLLPFYELLQQSSRQENFDASLWPMPLTGWGNFLAPLFHCHRSYHGAFMQAGQGWTNNYYVGALTITLAAWAVWRVRCGRVWLLAVATLLCLVLALGNATPIYFWLQMHFSVVGLMRFPVKFVVLPVLALPLLAAVGLAELAKVFPKETARTRQQWWIFCAVTVVAMLNLIWWARELPQPFDDWPAMFWNTMVRILFLVLLVALLSLAGRVSKLKLRVLLQMSFLVVLWLDVSHHAPQPQTVNRPIYNPNLLPRSLPKPLHGVARAFVSPRTRSEIGHSMIPDAHKEYLSRRYVLVGNCNLLEDISKVDGFFPLRLRAYQWIDKLLYGEDIPGPSPAPLLDFFGVSQINADTNIFEWLPRTTYLPLLTGGQKPIFADYDTALRALGSTNFAPQAEVYLPVEARTQVTATNGAAVKISSPRYAAHHIEARVEADAPALVVIAQTFYRPWRAYVDGRPGQLWRANVAFQAVEIPPGTHELKLVYEDNRFRLGGAISLVTLLICISVAGGFWRSRSKPADSLVS